MDETAIAFAPPHARASATHGGAPLDRVSVRDYVRSVDIGAFRSEQGVPQRIRFNVVLEVAHHAAAETDDVDQVVSYDDITDAIDAALAAERVDLLETLAERIARDCLSDARAVRVFVRVEKLDRIPGGLGVEIERRRVPEHAPRLRTVASGALAGWVVLLPQAALDGPNGSDWLDRLADAARPVVLCLEPRRPEPPATSQGARMCGLLAIEQAAWRLADRDPRFEVVASRTELDWALKSGRLPIWAPARMLAGAAGGESPDASDPAGLAVWLAGALGASGVLAIGAPGTPGASHGDVRWLDPAAPDALTRL
jgi:dihydroneopterin aldolase